MPGAGGARSLATGDGGLTSHPERGGGRGGAAGRPGEDRDYALALQLQREEEEAQRACGGDHLASGARRGRLVTAGTSEHRYDVADSAGLRGGYQNPAAAQVTAARRAQHPAHAPMAAGHYAGADAALDHAHARARQAGPGWGGYPAGGGAGGGAAAGGQDRYRDPAANRRQEEKKKDGGCAVM